MGKKNIVDALPQPNPMCGGDGPHSYFHNSLYQKAGIDSARAKIKEVILEKLDHPNMYSDLITFRIADFGCSVGPNTFDVVQNIIETIKLKYQQQKNAPKHQNRLEFHVFFNDQSTNDFNTLFRTLSPFVHQQCFVAGVPGSFYGRVLPRNTVNIGHTSYTLHWLSKVPQDICVRSSLAWNKNNIQCSNLVEEVCMAYKAQFMKDIGAFLEARGEELVPGGLMIMSGMYLLDGVPMDRTWKGIAIDMMGDCLMNMAKSGLISEEKVESFNLPIYFPLMSELKEAIERNGCFSIEVMERVIHPMEDFPLSSEFIASMYRAIFNGIIEEYFGDGVVDELFNRFAEKLTKCPIGFQERENVPQYFILLKRNVC